jgi:hypothetical protein
LKLDRRVPNEVPYTWSHQKFLKNCVVEAGCLVSAEIDGINKPISAIKISVLSCIPPFLMDFHGIKCIDDFYGLDYMYLPF